ncbi:MAG: sugar-transfer associated ATP-grasp domain-containing protein, partial [Oceanococcaceae bacterium]
MKTPWAKLREAGIVGMNARNGNYVSKYNARRLYPLVDDKLKTKTLALEAGIAVPELYGVLRMEHDVQGLAELVAPHRNFVIKPAHGAGGEGIVVVRGRQGDDFLR